MFGAEKFASTSRTLLLKLLTNDVATSRAIVVFPTPPLIETNAIMFDIFHLWLIKRWRVI